MVGIFRGELIGKVFGDLRRLLRQFFQQHGWRPKAKLRKRERPLLFEVGSATVVRASLLDTGRPRSDVNEPEIGKEILKDAARCFTREFPRREIERLGRLAERGVETSSLVLDQANGDAFYLAACARDVGRK